MFKGPLDVAIVFSDVPARVCVSTCAHVCLGDDLERLTEHLRFTWATTLKAATRTSGCLCLRWELVVTLALHSCLPSLWHLFPVCTAAAAAESHQSCPTLCDPMDCSPPGSPSLGFSRQEHRCWSSPAVRHQGRTEVREAPRPVATWASGRRCKSGPETHSLTPSFCLSPLSAAPRAQGLRLQS